MFVGTLTKFEFERNSFEFMVGVLYQGGETIEGHFKRLSSKPIGPCNLTSLNKLPRVVLPNTDFEIDRSEIPLFYPLKFIFDVSVSDRNDPHQWLVDLICDETNPFVYERPPDGC